MYIHKPVDREADTEIHIAQGEVQPEDKVHSEVENAVCQDILQTDVQITTQVEVAGASPCNAKPEAQQAPGEDLILDTRDAQRILRGRVSLRC